MVPFRPAPHHVPALQLGQLKANDKKPSTVELIQTMAVALAAGAGSTLTFLGIGAKDSTVMQVLKVALGTGLATISISTLLFGFRLDD